MELNSICIEGNFFSLIKIVALFVVVIVVFFFLIFCWVFFVITCFSNGIHIGNCFFFNAIQKAP